MGKQDFSDFPAGSKISINQKMFSVFGPYENFQLIPLAGKWVLIIMMLLGRLEIFTLLILFIPEFWKK